MADHRCNLYVFFTHFNHPLSKTNITYKNSSKSVGFVQDPRKGYIIYVTRTLYSRGVQPAVRGGF